MSSESFIPTGSTRPFPLRRGDPRLLIVGLAPGVQGANRTGRPFTGDFAGDLLYETLKVSASPRHLPRGPA
jgi:uracil-DNA glycosylase